MDAATLAASRTAIAATLSDTCTVRRNLGQGPAPASVPGGSDGRGGTGGNDGRGGTQDNFQDAGTYPCRLQAMPVMRGETMSGDKPTQRSRFVLVVPFNADIGNTDQVVTAAGNNGALRTLEVLDTGGRTEGFTRRVSVMEVK